MREYDLVQRGEVYNLLIFEIKKCNLGHEHKELVEDLGAFVGECEIPEEFKEVD